MDCAHLEGAADSLLSEERRARAPARHHEKIAPSRHYNRQCCLNGASMT